MLGACFLKRAILVITFYTTTLSVEEKTTRTVKSDMEVIVNALVLKAVDYKDNDKILTLYSLEKGKITAGIKGVKKSGAKLKFASEPFAFCEYVLAEKQGRYTVIGATYLDSFFSLRTSLIKYYASAVVGEALNRLTVENEPDSSLFSSTINAVKKINYQDNELISLAKYLILLTELVGYKIQKTECAGCEIDISGRVFFSTKNAEFYCEACRPDGAIEITLETYNALKTLSDSYDDAVEIVIPSALKLLKFLFYYIEIKTETKLVSGVSLVDFVKNTL